MEGILFDKFDCGQGGPNGFIHYMKSWCVTLDGRKFHIRQEVTSDSNDVAVARCDGSCASPVEIYTGVAQRALAGIPQFDRLLTAEEKESAFVQSLGATYLSEVADAYKKLLSEKLKERQRARAGSKFSDVVRFSWLGRLIFKHAIAEYDIAIIDS